MSAWMARISAPASRSPVPSRRAAGTTKKAFMIRAAASSPRTSAKPIGARGHFLPVFSPLGCVVDSAAMKAS